MSEFLSLREMAAVEYGASPKEIRVENETAIKIFGTGGLVGYSRIPLFEQPLVVVARKETLDKPIYSDNPCWVIDTAFAVIPKNDVDAKWLYYQLSNYDLKKLNEATGVPSISRDLLYRVKFEKPSFSIQRKIARILSTADAVIEKTHHTIAKYKAIKQGMLHDLFTRGIDPATDKLRPPYEDAPHLYKHSKLGLLPKEWEVGRLGQICSMESGDGITSLRIRNLDDYPVYGGNGLRGFTNSFTHDGEYILIGRQGALCGNVTRVSGKFYASEHAVVVTVEMDNDVGWLTQKLELMKLNQYSEASAQPGLSVNKVMKLLVIKPLLEEQKKISNRLISIDIKLKTEQAYLQKMQQIKAGIMADLLSGKKEVHAEEVPKH